MPLNSSLAQEPHSRSLDEIRKSEAELRQVVDTIPALVWSNLADGANDFSNQRWQDYTGDVAYVLPVRAGRSHTQPDQAR